MNEIIDTLIQQLGGEKFTALAQVTPLKFTPEVCSYLSKKKRAKKCPKLSFKTML